MIVFRVKCLHLALILALLCSCVSSTGVYHVVREGQTLYRISRDYGVEETYLARINNITDPRELPVGKRLFIPGAAKVIDVPATAKPPQPVVSQPRHEVPPPAKRVARPVENRPKVKPATNTSTAKPDKDRFNWPVQGKVIRCFSESGKEPCKGVEISTPVNTPVKAAAAGSVIYSGDGIRGYGNLIIIKHDDAYFTVYGYNRRNLVRSGAFVSKGEKIAYSGAPPGGGAPRLHFEIRYGKKSVDPSKYLP